MPVLRAVHVPVLPAPARSPRRRRKPARGRRYGRAVTGNGGLLPQLQPHSVPAGQPEERVQPGPAANERSGRAQLPHEASCVGVKQATESSP